MKQLIPILLGSAMTIGSTCSAQTYSSADITANVIMNVTHDSTACASTAGIYYMVTIDNSFMGDIAKVKDDMGNEYYQDMNATGQNPWILTMPFMPGMVIGDENVINGNLMYPLPMTKITTAHDTLYNIYTIIQGSVPDACSYNAVNGHVYIDNNSNCVFDSGDDPLQGVMVSTSQTYSSPNINAISWGSSSMVDGMYNLVVLQSWLTQGTVSIPSSYQFVFQTPPCASPQLTYTALPAQNMDFPLNCTSSIDLQASILSTGVVRPNIPFLLHPSVSNTGCDPVSGMLKLVLPAEVLYDPAQSSNPASLISGDTLMWNYSNLTNVSSNGYWNSFIAGIHLTPSLNVNIGDTLCFTVMTEVPGADVNPANNTSTICLPVVNSYDPNMKEAMPRGEGPEGYIDAATEKLTYTIHFQNTGNAVAYNIYVIDTLEANVDPSSLRILGATHYMEPEWLASNIVKFNFPGIFLADSTSNEPASHGAVSFEIDLNSGLAPGTAIENTGYIYFDFNPAIVTNTALNTIEYPLGLEELTNTIQLVPNPASKEFRIEGIDDGSVEIFNLAGQRLLTGEKSDVFNVAHLSEGVYSVVITTGSGRSVRKLVIAK